MVKFTRYTLATLCIAASVGCLALWGWTRSSGSLRRIACERSSSTLSLKLYKDVAIVAYISRPPTLTPATGCHFRAYNKGSTYDAAFDRFDLKLKQQGVFGWMETGTAYYFPLWYPALVFALAGVGVLRFRRQFSILSAMIATTIITALIGMAVIL